MTKVCVLTLGCKLNKYESDCMVTKLTQAGYNVVSDLQVADYYVINTCAVTKESEKKSRQYVTKCLKLNANAKVVVCGCASQNNINQFAGKPNVVSVFGNIGKDNIIDYLTTSIQQVKDFPTEYGNLSNPTITTTRAYLKVQDGCNNFCSYCLIPYLRGRSRSRNLQDCVTEAINLSKTSKEIVLTGIDLSDFKPSLAELLMALTNVDARIRLGSLEVRVVDDKLLTVMKSMPNFCPQFHLSLQSGDDTVLKRMNRHYTADEYLQKVDLIYKYFPDANITTDIIVGFAGETDEQFNNSVSLAKKAKFGKIHVFPYSPREGTAAYKLFEDTDASIKKQRVAVLSEVGKMLEQQFFTKNVGKTYTVLTEDVENEFVVGYTENYIKVYLPITTPLNQLVNVKLTEALIDGMKAQIV